MASSALAALGNYVDSEDEQHSDMFEDDDEGAVGEIVTAAKKKESPSPSQEAPPSPSPPTVTYPTRDPSPDNYEVYPMERDDTDEEEEEVEEKEAETAVVEMEIAEEEISSPLPPQADPNDPALVKRLISEGNIDFPPEPAGDCPRHLQDKINWLLQEMEGNKKDMNQVIQAKKSFRNPSIYEKLIQFCNIDEFGTNYPPEVYNPLKWDKSSYYDELAKVQKSMIDKKLKAKQDKMQGVVFDKQYKKPSLPAPGVVAPTSTASSAAAIPRRTTVF